MEWIILLWLVFGILTGAVATGRGRHGILWLLIGCVLGPIGLIAACGLPKTDYVYLPTHIERALFLVAVAMGTAAELAGLGAAGKSGRKTAD